MRSRLMLAMLVLSLPALSDAQRVVRPPHTARTPDRPAEKPPLMPGIHDSRLYSRYMLSRFSLEQYPMVSYFQTNGLVAEGIPADYWTFGDGTHIGFRAAPSVTVGLDFTSSIIGGPFSLGSSELGVRVKPWTRLRVTPFVDARMSWAYSAGFGAPSDAVPLVFMYQATRDNFTSGSGRGRVVGIGAETRLNARFWLTTGLTHARFRMTERNNLGFTGPGSSEEWRYLANATRLSVGVRYNHGRWLDAP
jgi:hypothetical protein